MKEAGALRRAHEGPRRPHANLREPCGSPAAALNFGHVGGIQEFSVAAHETLREGSPAGLMQPPALPLQHFDSRDIAETFCRFQFPSGWFLPGSGWFLVLLATSSACSVLLGIHAFGGYKLHIAGGAPLFLEFIDCPKYQLNQTAAGSAQNHVSLT